MDHELPEDREHSPIGASAAGRYLNCPASVKASHKIEDPGSIWTEEGTVAHHIAEQCLERDEDAWEYLGDGYGAVTVDQEMADAVQMYLDHCRTLMVVDNCQTFLEERFSVDTVHPLLFGTVDFAALHWIDRRLHVVDFKYGAGIAIDATENPQGRIYALGVIAELNLRRQFPFHDENGNTQKIEPIQDVTITIVQPRAYHEDGSIRSETLSLSELNDWEFDVLIPGIEKVKQGDEFNSGPWCRFCPNKPHCEQLKVDVLPLWHSMFDVNPNQVTDEQLSEFLSTRERYSMLDKAMVAEATRRLSKGVDIEGFKLVQSRTDRQWKSGADEMAELIWGDHDDLFKPRVFKSPAQIEKLGKNAKDFVKNWSFKPQGGFTIAPEDDNRSAVVRNAKDIFGSVQIDEET